MSGTLEGGKATARTLKARDPDYYKKMGALGGRTPNKTPKGFASMPKEKVSAAGRKGGTISRRKTKKVIPMVYTPFPAQGYDPLQGLTATHVVKPYGVGEIEKAHQELTAPVKKKHWWRFGR